MSLTLPKVDAYFARFHFLLPVLDKPSFLRKYSNMMDNSHDLDIVRSETAFLSLLFAVFACAANLVEDGRERHDDGGMGMVYYERALVLQYISHPNTQIAHVQCFVLMSSFLCSVNCLPQAWILIGQAVRTGQDLGLHVSFKFPFKEYWVTCLLAFSSPPSRHSRRKGNQTQNLVGRLYSRSHAGPGFGPATGHKRFRL
jgi:hypothetical protein